MKRETRTGVSRSKNKHSLQPGTDTSAKDLQTRHKRAITETAGKLTYELSAITTLHQDYPSAARLSNSISVTVISDHQQAEN
jgi:hypothetical protein